MEGFTICLCVLILSMSCFALTQKSVCVNTDTRLCPNNYALSKEYVRCVARQHYAIDPALKWIMKHCRIIRIIKGALDQPTIKYYSEALLNDNNIEIIEDGAFNRSSFKTLSLRNNRLTSVSEKTFAGTSLLDLILSNNYIGDIGDGIFRNLRGLRTLDISGNRLTTLTDGAFSGLEEFLRRLDLSYNRLTSLSPCTFKNMKILQDLDVSYNKLYSVSCEFLHSIRNPYFSLLSLNNNFIVTMPDNAFVGFKPVLRLPGYDSDPFHVYLKGNKLKKLTKNIIAGLNFTSYYRRYFLGSYYSKCIDWFESNEISYIEPGIFTGLRVNLLSFARNKLTAVSKEMFEDSQVFEIILDDNEIKEISSNTFHGSLAWKKVSIRNNKIKAIHSYTFIAEVMRFNDIEIDLYNNDISELENNAFHVANALLRINLARNKISDILPNAISCESCSVKQLDLSYNNFSVIHRDTFNCFASITPLPLRYGDVNLSNNNLEEIKPHAFRYLSEKTGFDLSHNKLMSLKRNVFENFKISYINLSHNCIEHLEREALQNMTIGHYPHGGFIDLSYNKLKIIPSEAFKGANSRRLIRFYGAQWLLNLSNNEIREIEEFAFADVFALSPLDISNNKIKRISRFAFSGLLNTTSIILANNKISIIEDGAFTNLSLMYLNLKQNKLKIISSNWLKGLIISRPVYLYEPWVNTFRGKRLHIRNLTMDLSYNKIVEIPHDAFYGQFLENLDISHNRLCQTVDSAFCIQGICALSNVRTLNLSSNGIKTIPDGCLERLNRLETLRLDGDLIDQIKYQGIRISFSQNPLKCDCGLQFLRYITMYTPRGKREYSMIKYKNKNLRDEFLSTCGDISNICDGRTLLQNSVENKANEDTTPCYKEPVIAIHDPVNVPRQTEQSHAFHKPPRRTASEISCPTRNNKRMLLRCRASGFPKPTILLLTANGTRMAYRENTTTSTVERYQTESSTVKTIVITHYNYIYIVLSVVGCALLGVAGTVTILYLKRSKVGKGFKLLKRKTYA